MNCNLWMFSELASSLIFENNSKSSKENVGEGASQQNLSVDRGEIPWRPAI